MKPKRVLVINSDSQTITESQVSELRDMQKIVGGLIERGLILDNGDELYVNEEGLFDSSLKPFTIGGYKFVGNAYVIGSVTPTGNNRAAKSSIEDLKTLVRF